MSSQQQEATEQTPFVARLKQEHPPGQEPTLMAARLSLFLSHLFYPNQYSVIRKGWLYFEHVSLPRRFPAPDGHDGEKAPPGHDGDTQLYSACFTPLRQFKDFGTGVVVYFATLRALCVVCLVAGLLYLPAIHYYGSDGYTSQHIQTVVGPLRGSLICLGTEWVPCPDCPPDRWDESPERMARSEAGLVFVQKNTCAPLQWAQGLNHLVVMTFLALAVFAIGFYQRRWEREYDEYVLSASDYSIHVDNPPADAYEPDEWKEFFSQFGPVAYVTVALKNNELLKALRKRRTALLRSSYRHGSDGQVVQDLSPEFQRKHPRLLRQITEANAVCRELLETGDFPVSAVFVTFEREKHQRACLAALQVGNWNVANNSLFMLPEKQRFRGNLVLDVLEPSEPTAIRWHDLDATWTKKILQRLLSGSLTFCLILAGFAVVAMAYLHSSIDQAALAIVVLNILMPHLFKFINNLESHKYESDYQASLYWKITIFRWVNTALVTILIKPFAETLSDTKGSLIASVHAVLRAEILIAPTVRFLDIGGFIKRFVLAPRAINESAMTSLFRGSTQNLGEKYTNATKTVFLVFFYSSIFPSGFFYGAVALFVTYVTEKFAMLRSWGPMPEVGNSIAVLSRKVFFPLTVVTLAVASEFFISAYPCDNVCDTKTVLEASSDYVGKHDLYAWDQHHGGAATVATVRVEEGSPLYHYCDQDFLERYGALLNFFLREHDEWMKGDQDSMTFVFGLFAVGMIILMVCVNVFEDFGAAITQAFGGYSTSERDSGQSFVDQPHVTAYIPQLKHHLLAFPLIAADIQVEESTRHLGWKDPVLSYEYYNLQADVDHLMAEMPEDSTPVLSQVRYYTS